MKSPLALLKDVATRLAAGQAAARAELINRLPPRQDLVRAAGEEVDAIAARFRTERALALARAAAGGLAAGGLDVGPDGRIQGIRVGSVASELAWPLDFVALCGLVPDAVKAGLRAILEGAAYEPGATLADRVALVAAVDAKVAELERQHTTLVDEAAALGIPLTLLPEEHGRRVRAERHREYVDQHNALNRAAIARGAVKAME